MIEHNEFWDHHVRLKDTPESVRVNGSHYRLTDPIWSDRDRTTLGFCGRVWTIQFDDGRTIKTNNLWHQGTIPADYTERLPNNAVFTEVK